MLIKATEELVCVMSATHELLQLLSHSHKARLQVYTSHSYQS